MTIEFLCWVVRDLRVAGKNIRMDLDAPAPHLNGPGRCLTFIIVGDRFGEGGYTPEDVISDLRDTYLKIYFIEPGDERDAISNRPWRFEG